jgi:hypothetical protein
MAASWSPLHNLTKTTWLLSFFQFVLQIVYAGSGSRQQWALKLGTRITASIVLIS